MSNNGWGGFHRESGFAGAHTVIAGREKHKLETDQPPTEERVQQPEKHTPTQASGTYNIYVPFEDKEDRITYLQNTLQSLQNLAMVVEAQLQREIEE